MCVCGLDYSEKTMTTIEDCASSCQGLNGSYVACSSCSDYYICRLD